MSDTNQEIFGVTLKPVNMDHGLCQAIRDIEAEYRKKGITITRTQAAAELMRRGMPPAEISVTIKVDGDVMAQALNKKRNRRAGK